MPSLNPPECPLCFDQLRQNMEKVEPFLEIAGIDWLAKESDCSTGMSTVALNETMSAGFALKSLKRFCSQ